MPQLEIRDDAFEAIEDALKNIKRKPKPIFLLRKIEGDNLEEICDGIWEAFGEKEKLYVLRKAGYGIN